MQAPTPVPQGTTHNYFSQDLTNQVDILFLIDDSTSMTSVQNNLIRNFPTFINVLKSLPAGLPDVHIAVVNSSNGAGAFTSSVQGCGTPNGGNFVGTAGASTCPPTSTSCSAAAITDGRHYLESLGNNSMNNFSGDISDAFCCIAQVGAGGCGFEHQLSSVRDGLGDPMMGLQPPAGNAGFLRDNAYLAVIFITNEDDCSAPSNSTLFDPNDAALGPLASFRCTEYGILCNGTPVPRQPGGPYQGCASNDAAAMSDPLHSLDPIQMYVDYFARIKPPGRVILAAVTAPTDPFQVVTETQNGVTITALAHSCSATDATGMQLFGDPPVRLKHVIDAAGSLGKVVSICQQQYDSAMATIAALIGRQLGRQCIDGILADKTSNYTMPIPMPNDGDVISPSQISCTVEDVAFIGTPQQQNLGTVLPCNPAGQPDGTCYAIVGDSMCSPSGAKVVVCRNGFDPNPPTPPAGEAPKYCPDGPNSPPPGDTAVVQCETIAQ